MTVQPAAGKVEVSTSDGDSTATPTSTLAFLPRSTSKKFPFKCHEMLSYAEKQGLEDVVCWLPGGSGFIIHDQDKFCKAVLKECFSHSNYKSFEKQCSNWMFKRELSENGAKIFSHPKFLRGRKSLCQNMTSKSTRTKKSDLAATKHPSTLPDLSGGTVIPAPGADDRSAALAAAFAQAASQQQLSRVELRNRLAAVAASSPAAKNALMNALKQKVAAKSAAAMAAAAAAPSSGELAVALAQAAVRRSAVLERLQLQQEFQRQQQALLLEHQKLEAEHQQQYEANLQLLLAAHQQRDQSGAAAPSFLQKIVKDQEEQKERAAALLALRVPR